MAAYDPVTRNGTLIDGLGSASLEADIAVADGRIADIGAARGSGVDDIAARAAIRRRWWPARSSAGAAGRRGRGRG